jgi:hypothetical protein
MEFKSRWTVPLRDWFYFLLPEILVFLHVAELTVFAAAILLLPIGVAEYPTSTFVPISTTTVPMAPVGTAKNSAIVDAVATIPLTSQRMVECSRVTSVSAADATNVQAATAFPADAMAAAVIGNSITVSANTNAGKELSIACPHLSIRRCAISKWRVCCWSQVGRADGGAVGCSRNRLGPFRLATSSPIPASPTVLFC